ncbi:hypothetical protein CBM2623_U10007 [Cupriavidus taiwanensis]|nr:hypothetical protein CBM2608_U20026 [Cupriavidus taiwanensis]SPA38210.1 hypothetical protein CBM2623_U10007 [Cupriavidus taiwanensis]
MAAASRAQLLDAYVCGAVPIENTQLRFKPGNQVVPWAKAYSSPILPVHKGLRMRPRRSCLAQE